MCRCDLPKHSPNRFCCAGCGRAFSGMEAFDAHRVTLDSGRRGCVDPGGLLRHGEPRFIARETRGQSGTVPVWGSPGTWQGPSIAEIEETA